MRVTMLVRCLAMMRGGGETRHLAWIRELTALGVDVDVIAGEPWLLGSARHPVTEAQATILRTPYLRDAVYRWQHRRGFGRATMTALHLDEEWFCRAAWRAIEGRDRRPDIVHAHAVYQAARHRRSRIPVVVNLPGAPPARYTRDLRAADALVADGWAAEHLPALLGCDVAHVPKGVDSSLFTPQGPNRRTDLGLHDKRVVLAVGRLVPIKNTRLLLDAMKLVRQRMRTAHLLLVGEGPDLRALRARAQSLGIEDAVTFAGYQPLNSLPAFYRSADVFALPSKFDNSPNVILEAMATGLPVVASDVGGVKGFVPAGAGGALVPAGDAGELAAALTRWLDDTVGKLVAARQNRRLAVERYSWRTSAERLLEVYERVLKDRGDRGRRTA